MSHAAASVATHGAGDDAGTPQHPGWHARPATDVLRSLGSSANGISTEESRRRLSASGPNALPRAPGDGIWLLLWRQVNNPLIWVLLASTTLAIALGKVLDGLVVLGVVVLNTIVGFVQEYRAGRAIQALAVMVPEVATVVRDGLRQAVRAEELVVGDIVALAPGDRVPADLRLLAVKGLQVQEAALTGESVPVAKALEPLAEDLPLADRRNLAFGGTLVAAGTGTGVVVATGAATELGRIAALLRQAADLQTPLTRQLAVVGRWLTVAIVILAGVLLAVGLARGYPLGDAMVAAISMAVGAIPEGLPAIVTISLAIGVQRMARRRAVIRRLPAVETLGSTTVICTDKTGTLTRNEMTVRALWMPGMAAPLRVSGVGYAPEGGLLRADGSPAPVDAHLRRLLRAGVLCNDARVHAGARGMWQVAGDPTEGALLVAARKLGEDADGLRAAWPRLDTVPFAAERQSMATLHRTPDGDGLVTLKGAPEVVLPLCSAADSATAHGVVAVLAEKGMRVLAFAARAFPRDADALAEADVDAGGFALLGLQAMLDPPRPEAERAVAACRAAGIRVKMITGDHPGTAQTIGQQLGLLGAGGTALPGSALDGLGESELRAVAAANHVFARVAPEHKLRLVDALQAEGNVVAMTGDGVNDAPALKQANIGVAMGITGTAVSKEAADVVLVDDNFASIVAAVEEGRRVYDNLVKALAFVLPTNIGLAVILLVAVAFFPIVDGRPLLPVLPTQILWVNLVATVTLALPLAFEAMEPDVMRRAPRDPRAPVLGRFVLVRTALVALLMAAGAVGLFLAEFSAATASGSAANLALSEAQTMAVTTLVLFEIFYVLHCRSLVAPPWRGGLLGNPWLFAGIGVLILLQAAFVYLPPMQALFGTTALGPRSLLEAGLVAFVILPAIGAEKWWRARRLARGADRRGASLAPLSAPLVDLHSAGLPERPGAPSISRAAPTGLVPTSARAAPPRGYRP